MPHLDQPQIGAVSHRDVLDLEIGAGPFAPFKLSRRQVEQLIDARLLVDSGV